MQVIEPMKNGYEIKLSGESTFLIIDELGDCVGYYDTERKARNAFNKIQSYYLGG